MSGDNTNNISGFLIEILQLCFSKNGRLVKNVSRETVRTNQKPERIHCFELSRPYRVSFWFARMATGRPINPTPAKRLKGHYQALRRFAGAHQQKQMRGFVYSGIAVREDSPAFGGPLTDCPPLP